jgi:hypothetical protein
MPQINISGMEKQRLLSSTNSSRFNLPGKSPDNPSRILVLDETVGSFRRPSHAAWQDTLTGRTR